MPASDSVQNQVTTVRDAFRNQQEFTWRMLTAELDPSVHRICPEAPENSRPLLCNDGVLIEKAACNFTHSQGDSLPPAASARNPHLAGKPFSASSLSVIVHPRVPQIPTTHMNVRFFNVQGDEHWHFGGGMDLTPHFLYTEDCTEWHGHAKSACQTEAQYRQFKQQCDEYFYLPHRQEARGIGGLFYDDLNEPNFAACLELALAVCKHFRAAYAAIFERRKSSSFTEQDEAWMLHRRSRYAEFNLLHDRGTKYGLQSARRVDSVLASMPPRAAWNHEVSAPSTAQKELLDCLQNPREW